MNNFLMSVGCTRLRWRDPAPEKAQAAASKQPEKATEVQLMEMAFRMGERAGSQSTASASLAPLPAPPPRPQFPLLALEDAPRQPRHQDFRTVNAV